MGRALTAALATKLQKAEYDAAGLWILGANAPGRRFYEGLGGTLVDTAVRGHGRLAEVAYGWRDLAPLAAAGPGLGARSPEPGGRTTVPKSPKRARDA
ncbi:hypothetical protein ACRAWG_08720 [Methylobacterium sp. P31]